MAAIRLHNWMLRERGLDYNPAANPNNFFVVIFNMLLSDDREFKKMEFDTGWSKSSIAEDIPHILLAIIEGLDDEVQWLNDEQRHALATQFDGIFSNCIGIIDVWECQINKSKNKLKEKATYSGKKKNNTKKVLAIIDYRGYFIFARNGYRWEVQ